MAEVAQKLAETRMGRDEFREFAARLILDTEESVVEAREARGKRGQTMLDAKVNELTELFASGTGNSGESRWDGLNAVTEYVDHKRKAGRAAGDAIRGQLARLDSAWFGSGRAVKQRALRLLTRW